jgi:hypothetical protein
MGLSDGTKEHRMYTSSVLSILILRISTPSTPWQALFLIWKVDSLPALRPAGLLGALAMTPSLTENTVLINKTKDGISNRIIQSLVEYRGNSEAMITRFLQQWVFDEINEECGPGHQIMLWAAERGNIQMLRGLFGGGMNVDIHCSDPGPFRYSHARLGTALYFAAANAHTALVSILLQKGACPDGECGMYPLVGATRSSNDTYDPDLTIAYRECVSKLLKHKASPDAYDDHNRSALS